MRHFINICFMLIAMISFLISSYASDDTLIIEQTQVTDTYLYETTPTLSADVVVYTAREMLNTGFFDQGDIWYQDLDDLSVGPVQITSDLTDDRLNDVSGDYIVYTAYDTTVSMTGVIMLYQISTGILQPIGDSLLIQEPRIHGDTLVWIQGAAGASEVMAYDLAWLGTTHAPDSLTGPVPPTSNVDIGDRFVVWVEYDESLDIGVYDLVGGLGRIRLTETAAIDERHPSTSGDWIVWEARDAGAPSKRIEAVNLENGDYRVIIDDGSVAARPSIHGDLIAYESNKKGNNDVYVYRISTEETFSVTTSPDDEYLNDVFGDMVAYVNYHQEVTGEYDEDIYVACLDWSPKFVKTDGSDSNNGTSWDDAFQTIQKAIDESSNGNEIWVKHGNYLLNTAIYVNKAVHIYGGFAGTEIKRDQRDWKNNVTKVDGQGSTGCFYINTDATINGLTITGGTGTKGGGICAEHIGWPHLPFPHIANCTFYGNSADNGGAIFTYTAFAIITNCIFYGNSATYGGAIYNSFLVGSPTITNCTFYGNSAGSGGAICSHYCTTTVTNSIFWGNTSPQIKWVDFETKITYCDIEGGYSGEGNINADPLFVYAPNYDFHLQSGSPCIDVGINSAPELPDIDFDGNARIMDGDDDGMAVVDMGAFEFPFPLNTPVGSFVTVQPIDATTNTTPCTITFSEITQAGNTSLVISNTGETPPDGFEVGDPPTYFDITTTAVYSGTIEVCINYSGISFSDETALRLYHYENGEWLDVTTSVDTENDIICGVFTSLSPFAIFEPINNPPVADADPDQPNVPVGPNCMASVTLDGSKSYDPDGDSLTYSWTWENGSVTGVNPTIQLPLGTYTITLVVSDGNVDSEPDYVEITVIDDTPPTIELSGPECVNVGTGKGKMANKLTVSAEDNCSEAAEIEINIDEVEVFNKEGQLVEGKGVYDIDGYDIYVYPNGKGWSICVTITATDSSGNSATERICKSLLKCKK